MKKKHVAELLVEQGLYPSLDEAKRAVMAGEILGTNEERLDKPGELIPIDTELHRKGHPLPYVSRGGFKLAKALEVFQIDLTDKVVLDIGSSTGGFTDVMLQNGAQLSYALDVGSNQLVWKLRQDPRVIVMEHTNFRYSQLADFTHGQPVFASIDVSFISLKLILPPLKGILPVDGEVVALIKPQFEADREDVGSHGIVRDPAVHRAVVQGIVDFALANGYSVLGLDFSPIKGGEGNIEFLIHLQSVDKHAVCAHTVSVEKTLDAAYESLKQ
ncbi:TlyA family RNA methyltransferase [Levilactobacillus spicheri]|uniref:Cell division protein FtsJ n=2 Tax=Levilactobacillus spicheri TaxID=216463 RepID=A0A0F3RUC1_9LACO|nr:TlyA family RNA methyltransferase [Levilactobacillus spicheri]KJW13490.1 cell division protein FtsJ [Levilactobacillus spicheri]KRL46385.1 rRNA methylase [Levilactobacillus spicheri DSM 15429]GEO66269.1 TlyA family rRNA (cytidine-2'-O)-methyltransferase [Levilactobacillus spicheri]